MTHAEYQVTGIGNAIVDVFSRTDDSFLSAQGLVKGSMNLVDATAARALYESMGPAVECSGGSAGNTMAGFASLGGRGAYIGKVSDDALGEIFRHDMRASGVHYETPPGTTGTPTARSMILVTPDAQRTMNTFLGACVELGPDDVDGDLIAHSQVVYLEGYLWDPPAAKAALRKAARVAHECGRKVSLTLSDAFCVDRHRAEFLDLVHNDVDVLFANEAEVTSLFGLDFESCVERVRGVCEIAALTRSEKGSVVVWHGEVHRVSAEPVDPLVDSTGAGDLYAAGFLYGLTSGRSPAECGRIGSIAAAEILSHFGARPETDLAALVDARMGR